MLYDMEQYLLPRCFFSFSDQLSKPAAPDLSRFVTFVCRAFPGLQLLHCAVATGRWVFVAQRTPAHSSPTGAPRTHWTLEANSDRCTY